MSVRWREDRKRFVVDYYPHGRAGKREQLTLPETVRDEATAREIERDLRAGSKKPAAIDPHATVKELSIQYLDYAKVHRAPSTYTDIEGVFRNWLNRHLGNYRVDELHDGHIQAYKTLRQTAGVKNRTINKELSYFSGFLSWCKKEPRNLPVKIVSIESLSFERPLPVVLTLEETMLLISNMEPLYRAFFVTLFSLGVRFSEASRLTWEDLDQRNRCVRIRETKTKQERLLSASRWLMDCLAEITPEEQTGLIFRSRRRVKPTALRSVRTAIDRAKTKAGIIKRVTPHLMRHSLATYLTDQDINIRKLQRQLGHTQLATTAWYSQVSYKSSRDISDFIDRKIKKARKKLE